MLRESLVIFAAGCLLLVPAVAQDWHPGPNIPWQIQFTGAIKTAVPVDVFELDLFDTPAAKFKTLHASGKKIICYFSAGSWEDWRPDARAYPKVVLGKPLEDWAGERWVDIRRLDILGPILAARMDLAVKRGCDAVDPDNVEAWDSGEPSGFPLTYNDQIRFNTWLADQAHARGLAIGLKNDLSQIDALLPYFDFAVNEQCFQYKECDMVQPFVTAGKAVFAIEYRGDMDNLCPKAKARGFSLLKKRLELGAWRQDCAPNTPSSAVAP